MKLKKLAERTGFQKPLPRKDYAVPSRSSLAYTIQKLREATSFPGSLPSFIFLQNENMAFSSQTTSENSPVIEKRVGSRVPTLCVLVPCSLQTPRTAISVLYTPLEPLPPSPPPEQCLSLAPAPKLKPSPRPPFSFLHPIWL